MGIILSLKQLLSNLLQLFPRYGGYSLPFDIQFLISQLFPRYGGYSNEDSSNPYAVMVVFPLWGLFLITVKVQRTLRRLLPRYGGYSESLLSALRQRNSCFPVMGVILINLCVIIICRLLARRSIPANTISKQHSALICDI